MKVKFENLDTPIYATSLLWGITGDIATRAERWRGVFKSAKYAIAGTLTFISSCKLQNYKCEVEYKTILPLEKLESLKNYSKEEEKYFEEVLPQDTNSEANDSELDASGEKVWEPFSLSDFCFFGIVTHEARSSKKKNEVFMPGARFDDNKMYIGSLAKLGKIKLLKFLSKFSSGNILDFERFSGTEVNEVKINPKND
mmetsp:Transcript_8707/g.8240  ORF Transcript_8707/g.8240 Transcript_8707/m.8240 type:complete len:198 (+) Transcript_8707:272-865(+)